MVDARKGTGKNRASLTRLNFASKSFLDLFCFPKNSIFSSVASVAARLQIFTNFAIRFYENLATLQAMLPWEFSVAVKAVLGLWGPYFGNFWH